MNIGLIGAGAIGRFLLNHMKSQDNLHVTSILVRDEEKYHYLVDEYNVELYTNLNDFLKSNIDIVVEAANVEAVKYYLKDVLNIKDMMVISIGAFSDTSLLEDVKENQHKLYLPSGAVGGLDLIQNVKTLEHLNSVTLTTTKPAASLLDDEVSEPTVVFEGVAKDAIDKFPKNMNVSIILSLAGLGIDETKVRLIADPNATKNTHHVKIEGEFGEATIEIKNNPLKENPKTSALAALSVLSTLERIENNIIIG
ncbi:aspartate dehydrogenase [Nosocomiicoccus ampullae]|uniref:L-aspartate dehydrogenase n=1 Tax=Nosocomiicoccus ampullae TaxID=489910 RepID=A0A9Q2CY33_9STAP|nr:aspartate dehydrogenase [Nosocomiicoccus ampullae]MBB5175441.1 aspartate dehydrogenase [Nosocomiicoccus ampullae]QYA46854.1 aspartate dehydrogenase [Nosocomiicoccus ampullae]